jgi:AcrR family transcriptional regulator
VRRVARATTARARRPTRGPGRPPGPSQAKAARARLVAAASEIYASGGDAALSYSVLAERCGLTKATLFHYFPTKDALRFAVFQALGERLEAAAEGWFDPPPASFAARLERLVGALVDFYGADPTNARILCRGLLETTHGEAAVAGSDAPPVFAHFVRRFTEFVAAGARAGEFHDDRPLATVLSIGGVVLFEFMLPEEGRRRLHGGTPPALEARRKEMVALVRRAVVRPAARLAGRRTPRRGGTTR